MDREAREFWILVWGMLTLAALLTGGAMYADPSPEACARWWRDDVCYPAAERAYKRDRLRAIAAALDTSLADYNPELARQLTHELAHEGEVDR